MNLIILLLIFVILYLLFTSSEYNESRKIENLEDLMNHSNFNTSNKCCEIRKIIQPNNTFSYEYNVKDNCRRDYNSNVRYIFENELIDNKPFKMDMCTNENKEIGSCRRIGFECMDFVTPEDCKKYEMKWSDKTCHDKLTLDIVYPDYSLTADLKTITR